MSVSYTEPQREKRESRRVIPPLKQITPKMTKQLLFFLVNKWLNNFRVPNILCTPSTIPIVILRSLLPIQFWLCLRGMLLYMEGVFFFFLLNYMEGVLFSTYLHFFLSTINCTLFFKSYQPTNFFFKFNKSMKMIDVSVP